MSVDKATREGGMMPRAEWESTPVHKASKYFCGKCGEQFEMPHDVYEHMDAEHPREDD